MSIQTADGKERIGPQEIAKLVERGKVYIQSLMEEIQSTDIIKAMEHSGKQVVKINRLREGLFFINLYQAREEQNEIFVFIDKKNGDFCYIEQQKRATKSEDKKDK